ncbi:MAG: Crp/Fnr family transcriptional regulator [Alphaproteobacteria bacterium]
MNKKTAPCAPHSSRSLDGVKILASLTSAERDELARRCNWRDFKDHEQIIDRDSDSRDVYFIVRGAVRVVNYSYSGREVSYDDITEGGFFGEMAAIDGKPRSATVIALNETTVASLPPETFRRIAADHPEFGLAIMERLVQIIRGSTDRIMDLSTRGAYSRVYAELLRLAQQHQTPDGGGAIDPLPVHTDLASRAGTTRETVARAIGRLSRMKVARKRQHGLVFTNLERLEELVQGDSED